MQGASTIFRTAIQKNAWKIEGIACILYLPTEAHILLSQKQASELKNFLEKSLNHPNLEIWLRAAPEKYPELKALQSATERWQKMVAANPALESFRQLIKGQIVPQDIDHEAISEQQQERNATS